jgi:endothelin-converting enzyme/putative endopeptidase
MRAAFRFVTALAAVVSLAVPVAAQSPTPAASTPDKPYTELPYTPSLDPAAMERSVDPCIDLYTYSCGGWKKSHPIPPDRSSWSVYGKTNADNLQFLWGMLEEAAKPSPSREASQALIGDFFAACMDEGAVESSAPRRSRPTCRQSTAWPSRRTSRRSFPGCSSRPARARSSCTSGRRRI